MAAEKPAKGEPALMKDLFFDPPEATGGKWKCKLCEGALTWRGSNSGYSAFVQHMKGSHSSTWRRDLDELKSNNARNGNLDFYVRRTVSDKAINLFNWIDWVVFEDLPFSAVENPRMRKYSSLQPITTDTLMKYMELLNQRVLGKLKDYVPDSNVYLKFDSWSCDDEHYTAVNLSWSAGKGKREKCTLCCGVFDLPEDMEMVENVEDDEEDSADDENHETITFSAEDYGDYILNELDNIGKSKSCIHVVGADNASVCRRLARLMNVPFNGCRSHRLSLAAKRLFFMGDHDERPIHRALIKSRRLMVKLSQLKNASLLKTKTPLKAVLWNETRWSSTFNMLERLLVLRPHIESINWPSGKRKRDGTCLPSVRDFIPTDEEFDLIRELMEKLRKVESVSKALQREVGDGGELDLFQSRKLFTRLIGDIPEMASHLAPKADIVESPHFEAAVEKVQGGKERELTSLEKNALRPFLRNPAAYDDELNDEAEVGYADSILEHAEAERIVASSRYCDLSHITSTNNDLERLFSRAKIVMRPHRKSMKPWRLEMLLFLRMNKHLWDVHDVHACLKGEEAAAVAEARDSSSPSTSTLSSASVSSNTNA